MKIISACVQNFGSYENLDINFDDTGLVLVYGPTGAGKSTLEDIVPWILYGETSKGGKVDDIRSWTSADPTIGIIKIQLPTETVEITRIRGKNTQNDLYITEENGNKLRGKDITETQKLIESRIKVTYETYITGACFNEFSPGNNFFVAKPKERRQLFDNIADLSFATKLSLNVTDAAKKTRLELVKAQNEIDRSAGRIEELRSTIESLNNKFQNFENDKKAKIEKLADSYANFEKTKESDIKFLTNKINNLTKEVKTCITCGNTTGDKDLRRLEIELDRAQHKSNPYEQQLLAADSQENIYGGQIKEYNLKLVSLLESSKGYRSNYDKVNHKLALLDTLQDVTGVFRLELLKKSISDVEYDTNKYLESFFDAELRVEFTLKDGDSLDIGITKNGHECNFKQLSKGQRQLLKLSFALAVMKGVSNKNGVHFDTLFFDEALDGLDSDLKIKAYRIFEELSLSHANVFVIDHSSELMLLFPKRYKVSMVGDISKVEQEIES